MGQAGNGDIKTVQLIRDVVGRRLAFQVLSTRMTPTSVPARDNGPI